MFEWIFFNFILRNEFRSEISVLFKDENEFIKFQMIEENS